MPHKDPAVARAWRHSRRDVINARKRQIYAENPEARARCLEQAQAGCSKQRYGVTREQVEAQRQKQGGLCALCPRGGKLHIDHDHTTGRFRGLLCLQCNVALGKLGDNEEGLQRALAYVSSSPRALNTSGSE